MKTLLALLASTLLASFLTACRTDSVDQPELTALSSVLRDFTFVASTDVDEPIHDYEPIEQSARPHFAAGRRYYFFKRLPFDNATLGSTTLPEAARSQGFAVTRRQLYTVFSGGDAFSLTLQDPAHEIRMWTRNSEEVRAREEFGATWAPFVYVVEITDRPTKAITD